MAITGATIATIIGVAVSVAAAGYGAYAASEAQAQQNAYAKRAARMQREIQAKQAEDATRIRQAQIDYDAKKKQRSFLSRAAAAGVEVGQGSLLETEAEFASEVSYAKQMARYNAEAGIYGGQEELRYQETLFGFNQNKAKSGQAMNTGIAAGSTLATGATKAYGGYGGTGSRGWDGS
jgi:hypothetical protein